MTRKVSIWTIIMGVTWILGSAASWAAEDNDTKQLIRGPAEVIYGRFTVALGEGGAAEVDYQPGVSRVKIKTLAADARIVVSARYLILIENLEGTAEIRLPTGRTIVVEPGKSEIVGRALTEDPGMIVVRLASEGVITVLDETPHAAIPPTMGFHVDCPPPCPRPERIEVPLSNSNPSQSLNRRRR